MAEVIWQPGDIFSSAPEVHKDFALVVLNQPLVLRSAIYSKLWERATYRIGADGGANEVKQVGNHLVLDTVIGDLDSLDPRVQKLFLERGSELIHDTDEYSTDFTKAVTYLRTFKIQETAKLTASTLPEPLEARKRDLQVKDIVVLGGLGGRIDQGMATMHQLYTFQSEGTYPSGRMFLLSSESITFVLKSGKHKIKVRHVSPEIALGKHIGIIPLKEASVITTTGLRWDVSDWKTEFGGQISTSNHVREDWVTIDTTKDVLFTIDLVESTS